jgi:hypothetical protein
MGGLEYSFIAACIGLVLVVVIIVALIRGKPRRGLAIASMLIALWAVSWTLQRNELRIRNEIRWLFNSKNYKAQVLKQPISANGELRHIEWDGWGFPGAGDTVIYLVYDPNDSLAEAVRRRSSGKFSGIPCEVPQVRRLENNWYTVLFYTDTDWGHCA